MPQIDFNIFSNLNFWTVAFLLFSLDNLVLRFFESYGFARAVGLKQLAGVSLVGCGSGLTFINKGVNSFIRGAFFSPGISFFFNFFFFKGSFLFLNFVNTRLIQFLNFEIKSYFIYNRKVVYSALPFSSFLLKNFETPEEGLHTLAPGQIGFSDAAAPNAFAIQNFHHDVMPFLIGIVIFVLYLLVRVTYTYRKGAFPRSISRHNTALEIFWTCLPGLILLILSIPSFALLYAMEEPIPFQLTVKCIAHQWYWDYEVTGLDMNTLHLLWMKWHFWYDPFMMEKPAYLPRVDIQKKVSTDLLTEGSSYYESFIEGIEKKTAENMEASRGVAEAFINAFYQLHNKTIFMRHLEAFNPFFLPLPGGYKVNGSIDLEADESTRLYLTKEALVLPADTQIRLLVTSTDVLHSWTVPAMGVKVDACPGRLNQINLRSMETGIYFGQCSEICGANHAFMPITLHVVPKSVFYNYVFHRHYMTDLMRDLMLYTSLGSHAVLVFNEDGLDNARIVRLGYKYLGMKGIFIMNGEPSGFFFDSPLGC